MHISFFKRTPLTRHFLAPTETHTIVQWEDLEARLIRPNLKCTNGYIHVIDKVRFYWLQHRNWPKIVANWRKTYLICIWMQPQRIIFSPGPFEKTGRDARRWERCNLIWQSPPIIFSHCHSVALHFIHFSLALLNPPISNNLYSVSSLEKIPWFTPV